jgi:hypothetical protein
MSDAWDWGAATTEGVVDFDAAVKRVNGDIDDASPEDQAFYVDLLVEYYQSAKQKLTALFRAANSFRSGVDLVEIPDEKFKEPKFVEEVRARRVRWQCSWLWGRCGCRGGRPAHRPPWACAGVRGCFVWLGEEGAEVLHPFPMSPRPPPRPSGFQGVSPRHEGHRG